MTVAVFEESTYSSYYWNREFHGMTADAAARIYPNAEEMEKRYQADKVRDDNKLPF